MKPALKFAVLALAAAAALGTPNATGAEPGEIVISGYVHDFDGGVAIGGETDPYGWVLSPDKVNRPITLARIAYLDAKASGIGLAAFAGRYCVLRGTLREDALSAGGVETPHRTFDVLVVADVRPVASASAPIIRLPARILADLEDRGVDLSRDGAATPSGGLTDDGLIDGKRRALVVPLFLPPPDSADMFTDLAYVDRRGRRYWAHRSGGFIGVSQWVGPFRIPRARGR